MECIKIDSTPDEVAAKNASIQASRERMKRRVQGANSDKKLDKTNRRLIASILIIVVLISVWFVKPLVEVAIQHCFGYSTERALQWIK